MLGGNRAFGRLVAQEAERSFDAVFERHRSQCTGAGIPAVTCGGQHDNAAHAASSHCTVALFWPFIELESVFKPVARSRPQNRG